MKASVAAFVCTVCACLIAPAVAAAHVDDVAATRAYLRASGAYERGLSGSAAASVAAIEARASRIAGECPSVLTYAPRDAAFGELGEEARATLYWAGAAVARPASLRFVDAIARLSWSDRRLTRLVHAEAAVERAIATTALPDVCADVAGWRASAYATLPQGAMRFIARLRAIESLSFAEFSEESREVSIMRLLGRYEGPAERRTAKRTARLEAQVERRIEAATTSATTKLAGALGVSTL